MVEYSELIKKNDWEIALQQFENLYVNAQINSENYILCIENCKKHIEALKDEVEKIVDEVIKDD